jgi:lactoylglutathione lyase
MPQVTQLRLVVTAPDYDEALHFYRDVLGMPEQAAFAVEGGRVTILDAGRATLEITDPVHAEYIDQVEVSTAATQTAAAAGATVIAEPTRTPWDSLNARLEGPAGLQLTLFTGGD